MNYCIYTWKALVKVCSLTIRLIGYKISYNPTLLGGVVGESAMEKDDVLRRLKNVEGHVRGVARMVENDAYCIDLIRQIQAVQAALNKVSSKILNDHLNSCLVTAIRGNDPVERERVLKEIAEVYEMASKV
jgi:DNA-binding FrmR family transcriptional regulator